MRRLVAALLLAGLAVPAGSSSGAGARLYAVVAAYPGEPALSIDVRDGTGHVVRSLGTGSVARWSPDGTRLAWVDPRGVHVEAADGDDARLVAATPATRSCEQGCLGVPNVAWSPDSRSLAIGGAGQDTRHLQVVDLVSGSTTDIAAPGSLEIVTGWTPDRRVVFTQ